MAESYLKKEVIRDFYDWFGSRQDWQRLYEGPALSELLQNGEFESASSVFELGCGTGAFALELLKKHLPVNAFYVGSDISTTMVRLSEKRLARFGSRAKVMLTDGSLEFEYPPESFDRFVANYVLDLLPPGDIDRAVSEAHRLLKPDGRLCLASLTFGRTPFSRLVTRAWLFLYGKDPRLVGGCRPLRLTEHLDENMWQIIQMRVVHSFGIASEIAVAIRKPLK